MKKSGEISAAKAYRGGGEALEVVIMNAHNNINGSVAAGSGAGG
jgi:hypothetical protein